MLGYFLRAWGLLSRQRSCYFLEMGEFRLSSTWSQHVGTSEVVEQSHVTSVHTLHVNLDKVQLRRKLGC